VGYSGSVSTWALRRIDAALEHIHVGGLEGVEAVALDRLEPAAGPLAEGVPCVGHPRLETVAAPILGAAWSHGRGRRRRSAWGRQLAGAGAELLQWEAPTVMLWTSRSP